MGLEKVLISWFLAGLLVWAFLPALFQISIFTGISFLVACALSFYKGQVIEKPEIIGYIAIGHVLTNAVVSNLLPLIYQNFIGSLFLQAVIIGAVFVALYLRGKEIQSGHV